MTGSTAVESSLELWNNHDREGYIACFTEDCEFNVPRRPARAGPRWPRGGTFTPQRSDPAMSESTRSSKSGQTVVLEAVYEATHIGPLRRRRKQRRDPGHE